MKNIQRKEELQAVMTSNLIELQQMDYKTSKYVDGDYTKDQWLEIVSRRKKLRAEYNAAEKELEKIIDLADNEEQVLFTGK
ncbi:MAG: hypothetical protein FWC02_01680 [Firmicutes bacterium]|nr:hypothetical protein [Bacillota bacterium]